MIIYFFLFLGALNLDGHSNNEFFQPEPALLDIADGTNSSNLPQEIVAPDNNFYRAVEQVINLKVKRHLLVEFRTKVPLI